MRRISAGHEQPKLDPEKDDRRADEPRLAPPRPAAHAGLAAPPEPDADRQADEGSRPVQQVQRVRGAPAQAEQEEPEKAVCREEPEDEKHESIDRETVVRVAARPHPADPGPPRDGQQGARCGDGEETQKLMRICHVRAIRV
jgi:hypothetical protein